MHECTCVCVCAAVFLDLSFIYGITRWQLSLNIIPASYSPDLSFTTVSTATARTTSVALIALVRKPFSAGGGVGNHGTLVCVCVCVRACGGWECGERVVRVGT